MSVDPTWFGPADSPIFGWLHVPEGRRVRGAIVCCTSVGTEATVAYRSLLLLAGQLEATGFAVLRFDYVGTGDSAGEGAAHERVGAWRASLSQAVRYVRRLGVSRVGLLGLRLGAVLAALEAATDRSLDAVALWDPCASGRTFVREQRALAALSLEGTESAGEVDTTVDPAREPGSLPLLGWVLGPRARSELEALSLDGLGTPAPHSLVLLRDDRPMPGALRPWKADPAVEWVTAVGQGELIDVLPNESQVPMQSLSAISSWFDQVMPRDLRPLHVRTRTEVSVPVAGSSVIRERAVRLGEVGLFAMVTEALGSLPSATVLLLNAGVIQHVGPARLWVTLARQLAARGLRVVRLDLSGLGDSPVRAGQTPHLAHPLEAMDDLELVLDGLGLDAEEVIVAGLCSGAYHAIEAGLRLPLRGVCIVNPILSFDPPEVMAGAQLAPERQAVAPFNGLIKRLRRFSRLAEWGEHRAPSALWWFLDKAGFQAHPAHGLEQLARRGVPVALLCGEVEARPFLRRARWSFDGLIRSGALHFDLLEADHNLFGAAARARAEGLILDRLTAMARQGADDGAPGNGERTLLLTRQHPA
jgi:alpha-beta hydrolase superfamily lysophospholipase